MAISRVRAGPTSRTNGVARTGWSATPMSISGTQHCALSVAKRKSQPRARAQPPPTAWPLRAATTGSSSRSRVAARREKSRTNWPGGGGVSEPRPRSAPAQKTGGAPVSTMARVARSSPSSARVAVRSDSNARSSAFRRSGRARVRVTTAPARATVRSIEALAEAGLHVALVVLGAAVGGRLEVDLVPQDPRHRGQPGHVGPALPLPEPGALEGLRAVEEALLDLDTDRHLRPFALHLQPAQDLAVPDDAGPTVHAQGVLATGDQEDHPDVRVLHDVGQPVDAVVADPVRDHEVGVVEHHHEAGRVPLRGDVTAARAVGRGEQHEGRAGDELAGVPVEVRALLEPRALSRRPEDGPQLLAGRHDLLEHVISSALSAGERLVADPVRGVGGRAQALVPVGLVVLVVALEPHHPAVALE